MTETVQKDGLSRSPICHLTVLPQERICEETSFPFVLKLAKPGTMTILYIFTLLSLLSLVLSAPTPAQIALAQKYAPQFRFHKNEVYFPSTVEYFLSGPVKAYDSNGPVAGAPFPLTNQNLGDLANKGSGMYLTTDINANMNGFLRGQNPSSTQTTTDVFIAPKANGVVDLYYWIFCPFNLGKTVSFLGIGVVGNHVGDWERVTVRTVNGVATSVDYHAHGDTGSGTVAWAQTPKFSSTSPNSPPTTTSSDPNARPVAYVSSGSHGFWSSAGTFTYVNAVVFQLQDVTSDGGVYWDTQNSLTTINYPDTYSGSLNWLNYAGAWGNKEVNNCWWHVFHDECKLVAGPIGPVRSDVLGSAKSTTGATLKEKSMGLPSQTLATTSSNASSTFSIYLDSAPVFISGQTIAVDQVCATLNVTTHNSSTSTYSYTSNYASVPLQKGATHYTIETVPCDEGSFVSGYSMGLCTNSLSESASLEEDLEGCSFGPQRQIRVFSEDASLIEPQEVAGVIVIDLDNWSL